MFTNEVRGTRYDQIHKWMYENFNTPWPGFVEILKLESMLVDAGIPYEKKVHCGGWLIVMNDNEGKYIGDAIEHCGSYGNSDDEIEIMGFNIDPEEVGDSVIGCLSADEAFEYFKRASDKLKAK